MWGEADGTNTGSPCKAICVGPRPSPHNALAFSQTHKEGSTGTRDDSAARGTQGRAAFWGSKGAG